MREKKTKYYFETLIVLWINSPRKLKLEKIRGALIILFYVTPSSPQLQILLFLLKYKETTTLQQFSGRNTLNFLLKAMLRYFLKIPLPKIILLFQDRIYFCIKNPPKTTTLQQLTGGETPNLVLMRMLEPFLKIPPLKKILKF